MGDNDVLGQFQELIQLFQSPSWRGIWERLHLSVLTFESLGLDRTAPDVVVWQACQGRQVILVTGNRKGEGADSLEATIRRLNEAGSLPVFTLTDPKRLMRSKAYADRVAERLLEYLMDIDEYRGAGRLWLP
jgi:hypothetical protein